MSTYSTGFEENDMKKLIIFAIAAILFTGCCTDGRTVRPPELVMVRSVPVSKYKETVSLLTEEIEKQNRYEAIDVKHEIYGGDVIIAVYAERMTDRRMNMRSIVKLQNEVIKLKRENASLKEELDNAKKAK